MTRLFCTLVAFLFIGQLWSQDSLKYWITFTDKYNNGFTTEEPHQFLSQRSIDRRVQQGIPTTIQDEPVTPAYVQSLRDLGFTVLHTSRWFNAATVSTNDPSLIIQAASLPYVLQTDTVAKLKLTHELELDYESYLPNAGKLKYEYGEGFNQIRMLNGDLLHDEGYTGKGILIAVLDAGFPQVNTLSGFSNLRETGRIVATRDFVEPGTSAYEDHPHGTVVLGTMAAYLPGIMIGTAPDASYVLLRTEDAGSEMTIEEANWVAAAEFADSIGADILNTSLGYTTFDDSTMSHSYMDMDGNTTLITRGADIAAQKGMLVVNSAGNSGNNSWQFVGAPADGDSVFTIGAVTPEGVYATFSSMGPTFDGRLKPNVVAQGQQAVSLSFADGEVFRANGTSFSSPIIAGMAACLWQAHPDKTAWEIKTAIEESADMAEQPNHWVGYGIPDFMKAHTSLQTGPELPNDQVMTALPNPFVDQVQILINTNYEGRATLDLIDASGRLVLQRQLDLRSEAPYLLNLSNVGALPAGTYRCMLQYGEQREILSIIKGSR